MNNSHVNSNKAVNTLPDTLSGLLEAAIAAARALDRRLYLPNHNEWHKSSFKDDRSIVCEVCLAGSVVAQTLLISPGLTISPSDFQSSVCVKLSAINNMRCGMWDAAYELLYDDNPSIATKNLLQAIPRPLHPTFDGWAEFESHLDSLEKTLPALREIDSITTFLRNRYSSDPD